MGIYSDRGYSPEESRNAIIQEIEAWYGNATLDTFDTSAGLGIVYRYECNEAAQLRFINGKVSNQPITLICGPVIGPETDPVWGWLSHTAVECGKVHSAYLQFSAEAAVKYQTFKTQAAAVTTVAQAEALFATLWS